MPLKTLVGDKLYRMGDMGPVVAAIQTALKGVGYPLKGTGYFGSATDTAVRAYQRHVGTTVDGVVGPGTAGLLDAAASPGASPLPKPAVATIERPLWLQAGIALIGTKEVPGSGDNPTIIQWAKDEGGDIAKEYTHDSIPWCALFANHCLTKAGLPGTETLWALDFAGKWPSIQLKGPAVGAFAPMLRNGGGHIIQVVGKAKNGNIIGLGANQSDQVSYAEFSMTRLNKGFWWPESVPVPPADQTGVAHLPIVSSSGRISTNES